jgi:hypothetical protein
MNEQEAVVETEAEATETTEATEVSRETVAPEATQETAEAPPWPEDWRDQMAAMVGGEDTDAVAKERKRLEMVKDPLSVYGMYREMENRWHQGGMVPIPKDDATDEERSNFYKTLGGPEEATGLLENLSLENDAVLGDIDRPVAERFAEAIHGKTNPQEVMSALVNEYFNMQEQDAAEIDDLDEGNHQQTLSELKEEYGPAFKRNISNLPLLFDNNEELYNEIMSGRTASGHLIGDYAPFLKWAVDANSEIRPHMTVVEDGMQSGMTIDDEIAAIEKEMRGPERQAYFKDERKQQRYRELLEARERYQARA